MSTGSFALTRATTPSWRFMSRLDGALEAMQGESMTGAARRMTHGVAECDSKPNAGHGLCEAWRSSSAWMLAVVDDRARGAASAALHGGAIVSVGSCAAVLLLLALPEEALHAPFACQFCSPQCSRRALPRWL